MTYWNSSWDSSYKNAKRLFVNAVSYDDMIAKSKMLKQAQNAAYGLPDDYPGKYDLIREIDTYAYRCNIDLSQISGY